MQNIFHSKNLHTFSELHTISENSNYGYGTFKRLMNEKIVRIEIMESSIKTSNDVSKLSVYDL